MKNSLSHLPQTKQDQILRIAEIIKEVAAPEKIILFGSYAKGNYVEHRYTGGNGIFYEYISDYDFLVVTKENNIKDYELEDIINTRTLQFKAPINLQIHEINYINEGLEFGQYFFTDIVKKGVLLYDTGNIQFAEPKELSPLQQKEVSQKYFEIWFNTASNFLDFSNHAFVKLRNENKLLSDAAFLLHQATERFYYATLLVFTGYKPKTHNLLKLRKLAKHLSEELFLVFPAETNKYEKHLFDLLKRGYIDARYKDDYEITEEELISLLQRVTLMKDIVQGICNEKINSYVV